jgi:hypothetical protein
LDPRRRPHPGPRSGGADALELPNSRAAQTEAEGRELAIVALATLNRASLRGLAYAASLGQPVLAVHVSPTEDEAKCFRGYWCAWGDHLRLKVVQSPYRAIVTPLIAYVESLHDQRPELTITVVVPEVLPARWWQ